MMGNPHKDFISVERQNPTNDSDVHGRITRLTNGFWKKWGNLKAAYALHFA